MVFMSIVMLILGIAAYISEFFQVAFQLLTQAPESLVQIF